MVTRNPLELPTPGRLLGLDYGKARVGVAVCDSGRTVASARGAMTGAFDVICRSLAALVAETGATGVVVGLPLNMDGSYGPMAQAAQSFAAEIEKRLGLPVLIWDERLTSRQAEMAYFEQRQDGREGRRQTRASKKDSVGRMDAGAAAVMLQSVLDGMRVAGGGRE